MLNILLEHLAIWAIVFIVTIIQTEDLKMAASCTWRFMLILYLWFGILYLIVINGGHLTI